MYNVWPDKVHNSFLSWHRGVMQNFWFGKWHKEYGKLLPEHLKVLKLGFWWDPFIQKRKWMSLNFTAESCIMTIRNDAKFDEESISRFKIDMRNLSNFDQSTQKSVKNLHFNGLLLDKVYNVWVKKVQGSYVLWH